MEDFVRALLQLILWTSANDHADIMNSKIVPLSLLHVGRYNFDQLCS